ncbi:MAG TPA: PilZ domain-containing protein [Candidatus Acidoferrales bacterium]
MKTAIPAAVASKPIALKPLPPMKPAAAPSSSSGVSTEERRRGQRVFLRVRASIHVAVQGKPTTFDATTVSVNHNGAMVILKHSLPAETRLVLEHAGTKERVPCKVIRSAQSMPEGFHTPIEFEAPSPNFWHIAFPPADWRAPDDL